MMDCERFLAEYSAYRDGELSWPEREAFDAHLDDCVACARYDRVVRKGAALFTDLPELEVSEDFGARLQHRLWNLDEERAAARRSRSGAGVVTVSVVGVAALAAAIPLLQRESDPVLRLPAVAVEAPARVVRPLPDPRHVEAGNLTSQLARLGVAVYEMPYHDLVFRRSGPLAASLASHEGGASAPARTVR